MEMTFTKGQYDVPEGKFIGQFLGLKLLSDTGAKDRDGNLLPPAMAWEFQIVEGEYAGKKCDRVTGRQPTPKSGCGKMLAAVTDQILKDGGTYDPEQFKGKLYRLTVEEKPTGGGTRVSDNPAPIRIYDTAAPPVRSGPPSRNKPAPPSERRFWVPMGDETPLLNVAEIRNLIEKSQLTLDAEVCPEGGDEYKALVELLPELKDIIPF